MIRIGSISRWQHLGPFVSEGRLIHRLEENEKIALNSNRRARNKIYKLFGKLNKTPFRIRMNEDFYLPKEIQEVLYYSVYEHELREVEEKLEEQHKNRQELMRNSSSLGDMYNLELILVEDRERELRSELHRIANDEGVKHIFD